jgi:predicted  nucleic acid-binding Zn-ribbon protein/TM2 domain-containing membrane protein YozV
MLHICTNCFESYSGKPEKCPHCGAVLREPKKEEPKDINNDTANEQTPNVVKQPKLKKQHKKRHKRLSSKEIMAGIDFEELVKKTNDKDVVSWREKRKKLESPAFSVDKNGEYNIDVKDVTYLPDTYNYSVKKARGEYVAPKIKWWEIYKWADLMLARRKIKKQVKKAGHYRPQPIKKHKMILLNIFFGWFGAHNFYARNYRKGWFTLFLAALGITFIAVPALRNVAAVSIGGGCMFVVVVMWWWDLIDIITNSYTYRLSKWRFIDDLNADTRAKLGLKYLDKDEYKKPWIVRVVHKISKKINAKKERKNGDAPVDVPQEAEEVADKQPKAENIQPKQTKNKANKKKQPKIIKVKK